MDYVGRVPLLWYGPGYVPATGPTDRRVTLADLAPTQAELLGFDFDAPDGEPLVDALVPREDRPEPPALLVVLVWDGAGKDVLDEHPDAWPNLRASIDEGVWYTRAEAGSSPPSTAIHATTGTGAFSATHGAIAHHFRIGDRIVTPWEAGPRYLMRPTLADLYDRALGNRPLIGVSATVAIQLGMVGHGSLWGGGDRDLVVLREREGAATLGAEGIRWNPHDRGTLVPAARLRERSAPAVHVRRRRRPRGRTVRRQVARRGDRERGGALRLQTPARTVPIGSSRS